MSNSLVSYFNPLDNSFTKYEKNLTGCQQTKAYIAGILGFGVFSWATYRLAVQTMSEDNAAAQKKIVIRRKRTVHVVISDNQYGTSKEFFENCKKGNKSPTVHPLEQRDVVQVQAPVASQEEQLSPTEQEWMNAGHAKNTKTSKYAPFGYFS